MADIPSGSGGYEGRSIRGGYDRSHRRQRKGDKQTGLAVAVAGVASIAASETAASQALAVPDGFVPATNLQDVSAVNVMTNGSLEIVLSSGEAVTVGAEDFVLENGILYIRRSAFEGAVDELQGGALGATGALAAAGGLVVTGVVVDTGAANQSPPVFTSPISTMVEENTSGVFYQAVASDADGNNISFAIIGGPDADNFTIDSRTGELAFVSPPDFEAPSDSNRENVYSVTIQAFDGLNTTTHTVSITVTNVNDNSPVFTSGDAVVIAENSNAVVYTAAATDADNLGAISFSLSGADAELFDIDASTGDVTFRAAPDFEAPTDADGDNVYEIVITANDGINSTAQTVAITVADIAEREVVDASSLAASQGFILQGDETFDGAGMSVASAGDINGDGFDDLIIGAPIGDAGGEYAGEAYVIFGSGTGFGVDVDGRQVIDLTALSASEGFIIQGDVSFDQAGTSVASAGDINGDGFDDLIIGAFAGADGGSRAGEAYVIFGSGTGYGVERDGRQVVDLTSLSSSEGFIVQGDASLDRAGVSVSSAGDVNGDGFDDFVIGASHGDDGDLQAGEAYVIFGGASGFGVDVEGRQVIDLTTLSGSEGFIIQGDASYDRAGVSVSSAGDINGDGFDDLIIGAPEGDDGGQYAGEAYVIFGSSTGFGVDVDGRQVIDLTTLSASEGFIIQGDEGFDQAGRSVSSAGDINGDGFDDLIVGAFGGDDGDLQAGEAYVIFGGASGFGVDVEGRQVIDLTTLSASEGFIIQGDAARDVAGLSVSSAGDVNGDGYDDLIVGAPGGGDGGEYAGEAYVIFGSGTGFGADVDGRQVIDLTALSASEGFIIQGDVSFDQAGASVSSAGDVNGDGFDDLIVGAPSDSEYSDNQGEAYLVYGFATQTTTGLTATGTPGADVLIGTSADDTLAGAGGADVVRAGAGDDVIGVSSASFARIHGGRGDDTLRVDGAGVHLDFTSIPQNTVTEIERIDLMGSGDNTLTISVLDLFDIMETRHDGLAVLRVSGDSGDTVNLSGEGWALTGQITEGSITYDRFTNGNGEVWVETVVTVSTTNDFRASSKTIAPVVMEDLGADEQLIDPAIMTSLSACGGAKVVDGFLVLSEAEEPAELDFDYGAFAVYSPPFEPSAPISGFTVLSDGDLVPALSNRPSGMLCKSADGDSWERADDLPDPNIVLPPDNFDGW